MEKNNNKKTYWPHMIAGFLLVGFTLGYWTVKSASSMPVQESNSYMLKYQQADIHMNQILKKKAAFDKLYTIELDDIEMMVMTDNINSKRPQPNVVKLSKGLNSFNYKVLKKDGSPVSDANVTFLLTEPYSRKQDTMVDNIQFNNGIYHVKDVEIQKPGRYTLQFRAIVGDVTGYTEMAAYLKP